MSSRQVYKPQVRYSAAGEFMHFKQFSVESRSRVVAVSAGAGVPVSNQWDPAGYFYPTQVQSTQIVKGLFSLIFGPAP